MQLWFAREGGVTIREQLVTQVVLGILSDELAPGQRLPSTRELARRFRLHPNTISAGYRQLERDRWVEFRQGSGVYVRDRKPEATPSPALALDQLVASLFPLGSQAGHSAWDPASATAAVAGTATARSFPADRAGRGVEVHCGG